jgi:hypothetical protein
MDFAIADKLFRAHTQNVRLILTARSQIKRAINSAIKGNDGAAEKAHTLTYALLFCAWAEVNFQKLIHTPHGFTPDEIVRIQRASSNVEAGWIECVRIGLCKVFAPRSGFVPNAELKLRRLISDYVVTPSILRNKIAHGQWHTATNADLNQINQTITTELGNLDIVTIDRWFVVHEKLAKLIEHLVEMKQGFPNAYWEMIVALEHSVEAESKKTMVQKRADLLKKLSHRKKREHI